MILAGKAYYDGVAKIGEIATGSPVSTELGEPSVPLHVNPTCHPVNPDRNAWDGPVQNRGEIWASMLRFCFTAVCGN